MAQDQQRQVQQALDARFQDAPQVEPFQSEALGSILSRGSCRRFLNRPVPPALMQVLCAAAMASPTKSDLQQRDIIVLHAPDVRQKVADLVSGQHWVAGAPMLVVICGNNRRQRLVHGWHGIPFANDHLDAFTNATADAAIALGAFVAAADALGLGTCPISAVRNEAQAVSDLLGLPDHVFPFAGVAVGYPAEASAVSMRLPLGTTCHVDRYQEDGLQQHIQDYDAARSTVQPYASQRFTDDFGASDTYGWSEDKARQYSQPERADFGAYIRKRGFSLE